MFALRICRPPSWMRERVRSRIKSRPSESGPATLLTHPGHSPIDRKECLQ